MDHVKIQTSPMLSFKWKIKEPFLCQTITPSSGSCPRLQQLKEVPSYLSSCSLAGTQQAKGKMISGLEAQFQNHTVQLFFRKIRPSSIQVPLPTILLSNSFPCLPPHTHPFTLLLFLTHRPHFHRTCPRGLAISHPPALSGLYPLIHQTPAHQASFSSSRHIKLLPISGTLLILSPLPESIWPSSVSA